MLSRPFTGNPRFQTVLGRESMTVRAVMLSRPSKETATALVVVGRESMAPYSLKE